jgi:hypothetical protein
VRTLKTIVQAKPALAGRPSVWGYRHGGLSSRRWRSMQIRCSLAVTNRQGQTRDQDPDLPEKLTALVTLERSRQPQDRLLLAFR